MEQYQLSVNRRLSNTKLTEKASQMHTGKNIYVGHASCLLCIVDQLLLIDGDTGGGNALIYLIIPVNFQ